MLLTSGAVSLRPLQEADGPLLAPLANNKKVWNGLRNAFPFPYSLADAQSFIETVRHEEPALTFAITFEQEPCGVIGLVRQKDVYRYNAEIGYWLGEPYWNKGIASRAVKLMTEYGFHQLSIRRIYAGVFEYNLASMRVLEKNGFEKEGISRKAIYKNRYFWDEHRYALLRQERAL